MGDAGHSTAGMTGNLRLRMALLLLLAGALRLVTVLWGTPLQGGCGPATGQVLHGYHFDEGKIYRTVENFPALYLNPKRVSPIYGTSLQAALGALLVPWRSGIRAAGYGEYWTVTAWIATRLLSVALSVATVWLVYLLGRRVYGDPAGWYAALLLAVSPGHVFHSSLATLDAGMGFLVAATALAAHAAVASDGHGPWVRVGFLCGITAGGKFNGFLVASLPLVMASHRVTVESGRSVGFRTAARRALAGLAIAGGTAALVFAATNPQVVSGPGRIWEILQNENRDWVQRVDRGWWSNLVAGVRTTAGFLGWAWLLLAGLGWFGRRRVTGGFSLAVLVFMGTFFLFWRGFLLPRYLVTLVPLFACLGGAGLAFLAGQSRPAWRGLGWLLFATTMAGAAGRDFSLVVTRLRDPRPAAARYLDQLPEGSALGVAHASALHTWQDHAWAYPWVDPGRFRLHPFLSRPEYLVVSGYDAEPVYQLLDRRVHRPDYTLPETERRNWYRHAPPSPEILRFFEELRDPERTPYHLLAHFVAPRTLMVDERPPEIRVYQRKDGPARRN